MRGIEVGFAKLHSEVYLPERSNETDSGYDIFSAEDAIIKAGETRTIHTGIVLAIPKGYGGFILPRSGLAIKYGIDVANSPGLIDSGYRGEILVGLRNNGYTSFHVEKQDRVAQLVIMRTEECIFYSSPSIINEETDRKDGGLGSTGY